VTEHKQVIPFRRFAGGVGRASQAKEFKTTKGECREERLCSIRGHMRGDVAMDQEDGCVRVEYERGCCRLW
jgi:hypothetical protein